MQFWLNQEKKRQSSTTFDIRGLEAQISVTKKEPLRYQGMNIFPTITSI